MTQERRNLYRILHVQPEAPAEIIKASYRALMSSLRAHPDLGGDADKAADINHAYELLMDPERRRAYDEELRRKARARANAGPGASPQAPPSAPRGASTAAAAPGSGTRAENAGAPIHFTSWQADRCCPYCRTSLRVAVLKPDTRCGTCDSPLMPAPGLQGGAQELLGRRGSQRHARDTEICLRLPGIGRDLPARLRNLSLTGLALTCGVRMERGSVMRVISPQFDTLVGVVHRRAGPNGEQQVHGQLLTLQLLRTTPGVFVSVKA